MKHGIYSKNDYQIIITKTLKVVFYDKEFYFGCQIYQNDSLINVIEYDKTHKELSYAYLKESGKISFNDLHYTSLLGLEFFEIPFEELKEDETLENYKVYFNNQNDFILDIVTLKYLFVIEIINNKVQLEAKKIKYQEPNIYSTNPYIYLKEAEISYLNINNVDKQYQKENKVFDDKYLIEQ